MNKEETSSEMLIRLGMDGQLWAKEFIKLFGNRKEEIDESLMAGWFANSIMAGWNRGYDACEKKLKGGKKYGNNKIKTYWKK